LALAPARPAAPVIGAASSDAGGLARIAGPDGPPEVTYRSGLARSGDRLRPPSPGHPGAAVATGRVQ